MWKFEYVNVLATSVRKQILTLDVAMDALALAKQSVREIPMDAD